MTGMLDFLDILQLVVNGLNNGSLAQHQLIEHIHQLVFHVLFDFGDKLDS